MTRIALVGAADWSGGDLARRALTVVLPEADVQHLPAGADPSPDLDGLWLLAPPVGSDPFVHDLTTARALDLDIPLVGSVASPDEGGTPLVRALPGSRLGSLVGEEAVHLPAAIAGGRPASDYVTAPGTVWFSEALRGAEAATVTAEGTPFVTLSDYPLATEAGLHPLLLGFAAAVRDRAARRGHPGGWASVPGPVHAPAPAARPQHGLRPLPDDVPRSYVHQARTQGYRWWRPLVALVLGVGVFVFFMMALLLGWYLIDPDTLEAGVSDPTALDLDGPVPMLFNNLMLAALIPATLVATRLGHWRPMGIVWSVVGRIRWGWLLRATVITTLLWGGFLVGTWFLTGQPTGELPEHQGWLIAVVLLTTPLQSAGEEVAFRGGVLQGLGAWIKNPVVAFVAAAAVSTALFALAHGSLDPWVLIDLGAMALATCYLTWRTGGLEAAIVLHAVNNVVIMVGLALVGGLADAFVMEETTSTAGSSAVSVVATLVMTLVLVQLARRAGLAPKKIGAPALG